MKIGSFLSHFNDLINDYTTVRPKDRRLSVCLFLAGGRLFFATFQSFCSKRWLMLKICAISQKIPHFLYFNLIFERVETNVWAPRYERFFESKVRLHVAVQLTSPPVGGGRWDRRVVVTFSLLNHFFLDQWRFALRDIILYYIIWYYMILLYYIILYYIILP